MTTETMNRGIVSATFARDLAEMMSVWHTLRIMVREQFPAASEEEVFQIVTKLMKKALRHAAKLEAVGEKPRKRNAKIIPFHRPRNS